MREQFLPFCRPCVTDDDVSAVVDVLKSGWITTGPKCTELEELFTSQLDVPGAVACTSGTGAMHCVLKALNIGPGDEVITPSMTWLIMRRAKLTLKPWPLHRMHSSGLHRQRHRRHRHGHNHVRRHQCQLYGHTPVCRQWICEDRRRGEKDGRARPRRKRWAR